MTEKPTYEELEKKVAELQQQVDQNNSAGLTSPPELLSFLIEAFRQIPLCNTFEDAAREIFEHCKRLTGARSGYVALLNENGEGNEVLFLDAGGMPCDVDPNLPMPIRGLREIAYRTKEVAFDNSFSESPWMKYMPEGHVKLDNVLFAPLNIQKKTEGVIGIANKDGGFNEHDVHISKILGDLAAVALSYARAQENLRENEATLRSMLDASPLAIVLLNRSGCILDSNEEHASRLNVSRNEILGRCLWELLPKEVLTYRRRQVEAVFETGTPFRGEDKRGNVWNQYHIHPAMVDHFGKVQAVIVEAIDITERKIAEKELSQIFSMSMDMLCIADIHHSTFIKVNPAFTETLGFTESELLGNPFFDFIHPEDIDATHSIINKKLKMGEKVINFENRYQCKDGKYRWLSWSSQPNIEEGVTYGAARDITEQKQQAEALEESKAFLDNMSDVAYIADDQGNLTWVNSAVRRMTGFLPEELIGKPFLPLFIEEDHASLMDVYQRTLNGEKLENTLTFKTGITCHFTSLPKRKNQGDIIGTFGVARDISKRLAAEHALQTSEARLKKAQKLAKVGNWEYDIATGNVWGSEEAFRIYGIERKSEFLPLDEVENHIIDVKRVNQALEDLITKKTTYDIEYQINSQNREGLTYIHSMAELVFDGDGKPEKVVGVIQDITESKQAEKILQKNHEMLKRTEAMASIGSWEWDVQHDRVYWSEELFRIFGLDPAEDAPCFAAQSDLYANGDMQRLKDAIEICLTQGTPYEIELRALRPDGEIRHCVSRGQPQCDANGNVFRLTGSFQDITDRRHAENRFKFAERRNQALLDHSPVCHKIVDLDFKLQYMSANGFNMLGLGQHVEVYGKPYPFEFFPEPFQKRMTHRLLHVRQTGETIKMEALASDIQGNDIWLDSSLIPVFDDDGEIKFITVVSANTTQRKQDELERNRLEARLKQAQKMESIGSLAGGIAHDFNNILFPIVGLSEMMLDDFPPGSIEHQNLHEIFQAGKRGRELVQQILSFSRQSDHQPIPVHIQKILNEVLKLCRATIPADITITQDIMTGCGPVMADPTQIHQIAMNLITNAYHAVELAGGSISIQLRETDVTRTDDPVDDLAPGRYAMLSVTDTGIGIDRAVIDKIFDPYFTTKEKGRGTGLGLATVYGIVKAYRGDIRVTSDIGKGAAFHVCLPLLEKAKESEPEKEMTPLPTGTEHILLVDDEKPIVDMEKMMLERLGYHITTFTSSLDALSGFINDPDGFDLIITDMNMPNANGMQLSEQINAIRSDIPVIICTGFSERINNKKAEALGIRGVLMKPSGMKDLAQKVREVLDTKRE
jgi:PAS domain S-box-containing protein